MVDVLVVEDDADLRNAITRKPWVIPWSTRRP